MRKSEAKSNKSKPTFDISRIDTPGKQGDHSMMNQSIKEELGSFFKMKGNNTNSKMTNSFSFNETRTDEKEPKKSFILPRSTHEKKKEKKSVLKGNLKDYKSPDFYRESNKDETQYRLTKLVDIKNEFKPARGSILSDCNLNELKLESQENVIMIQKIRRKDDKENLNIENLNGIFMDEKESEKIESKNSKEIFGSSLMKFGTTEDISHNFETFKSREAENYSSIASESQDKKIYSELQEVKKNHYLAKKTEENKENYSNNNNELLVNPYSSRSHYFSSQTIYNTYKTLNSARNNNNKKIEAIQQKIENIQKKKNFNTNHFFSKKTHHSYANKATVYQECYRSEAIQLKNCDKLKENGFEIEKIDNERNINEELFKVSKGFLDMCKDITSKLKKSKRNHGFGRRNKFPRFADSNGYQMAKMGVTKAKKNLKGTFGIDVGNCSFSSSFCGKRKPLEV